MTKQLPLEIEPHRYPRDLLTHRRRRRASRRQVEAAIEAYRPIRAPGQAVNIVADHKPKC